jgi:hypothetical protein
VKKGFVVDTLPRTGSTTLARLLNCHPDIKCLIEPFHPRRYEGQFHRMALDAQSVEPALNLIWHRWNGIKHVWDASRGWPFSQNLELNDHIPLGASHVIFLDRRNRLRRYVSGVISVQLNFWIGTRQQFQARLENACLKELDPAVVLLELEKDKAAIERRLQLMRARNIPHMHRFYEELFEEGVSLATQFEIMNKILGFLGFREVSQDIFEKEWTPLLDRATYQWASPETYRMIPGIERLEREIGSDETGWLF